MKHGEFVTTNTRICILCSWCFCEAFLDKDSLDYKRGIHLKTEKGRTRS